MVNWKVVVRKSEWNLQKVAMNKPDSLPVIWSMTQAIQLLGEKTVKHAVSTAMIPKYFLN